MTIRTPVPSPRPEKAQAEIRPHQRAQGCCLWRGGSGLAINCPTIAPCPWVAVDLLPRKYEVEKRDYRPCQGLHKVGLGAGSVESWWPQP